MKLALLALVPTRWQSEDSQPKNREANVRIYAICGLPRRRAGDIRRVEDGMWELWLTDAMGILRPIGVFTAPRAALDACEAQVFQR